MSARSPGFNKREEDSRRRRACARGAVERSSRLRTAEGSLAEGSGRVLRGGCWGRVSRGGVGLLQHPQALTERAADALRKGSQPPSLLSVLLLKRGRAAGGHGRRGDRNTLASR